MASKVISNNLTQLIPGVGALGLAFSAIVTAVSFAQIGFRNWTRGIGENKEEIDKWKASLDDANKTGIATGVQLQSFVDIARDSKKPLEERNYALKQANDILGEHGEKLTLVNINTKAATDQV